MGNAGVVGKVGWGSWVRLGLSSRISIFDL